MTTTAQPVRRAAGRRVRRLGAALLVATALAAPLAGCATGPAPVPAAATPTTTPPPPPPPPPPVLWPLTGVDSAGAAIGHPALAVKIENSVTARPQTGLNAADLVWEQVVEGGIPRYVAVYHSTVPGEIGPVRSVRPMDPAIAAPLGGLFAFSGGQRAYVDAVAAAGLQVLSHDAGAAGFSRLSSRRAPHNMYADPHALLAQADAAHAAPPPPQFAMAAAPEQAGAVVAGAPAGFVDLTLSGISHPRWTWSPPDGRWVRAEAGIPAVEADGTPIRATNVVVLRVDVVNTGALDPAGNPVPETVVVGGGDALVATGGKALAATWAKPAVGAPVTLTAADGSPVPLAPGTTWIELVPNRNGSVVVG
ncbi:DUF3048 domain-containing protein [Blastococcus sp. VKM Ac-2987]|uniref:DUF3048 domain-containing protein n=1 Tax=Blastococcus sp. VKM Ac-2987 TaxID=3004141 RepID=UPI0022ABC565|nr:DUF3048 domain-containing protein [Blastococcus sp. VKM Ac-2987]MCZ2860039.1 DUF3048 domain-containing protein [Blastococcus sp. VKM Ac-2987]